MTHDYPVSGAPLNNNIESFGKSGLVHTENIRVWLVQCIKQCTPYLQLVLQCKVVLMFDAQVQPLYECFSADCLLLTECIIDAHYHYL